MVLNHDNYTQQITSEMEQTTNQVSNLFNDLLNKIFNESGNIENQLSDSISSGVKEGVESSKAEINSLTSALDKINEKIKTLKSNKNNQAIGDEYFDAYSNLLDKLEDPDSGFDINSKSGQKEIKNYVDSLRSYIGTLEKTSAEYKDAVNTYNDIFENLGAGGYALKGTELPAIESIKTYTDLLNEAQLEQQKLNIQIEEQQKILNESSVSNTNVSDVQSKDSVSNIEAQIEATQRLEEENKNLQNQLKATQDEMRTLQSDYEDVQDELMEEVNYNSFLDEELGKTSRELETEQEITAELRAQNEELKKINSEKVSPSQEFDNVIQKDIVYLENYKNTIEEINKLKVAPQTDEAVEKMEELQKLADYFFGNISITKNQLGNDGGNFANDWTGSYRNRLNNEGYGDKINEIWDIGKDMVRNSNFNIDNLSSEFHGIGDELQLIESKSESLKQSLNKDLIDSIKYVEKLDYGLETLADAYEVLHDSSYSKDTSYLKAANKDIESVLKRMPELEQFKDMFHSDKEAYAFVKTDEWNNFLATLPRAHAYLESIGYDFEKVGKSADLTSATDVFKEQKQNVESVTEALEEKQKIESQSDESISAIDEIGKLESLRQVIEDVQQAIKNKTDEFGNEATAVDGFVNSELSSLQRLYDSLEGIKTQIVEIINKLQNSNGTEIIFTPKLSDDFNTVIQDLIEKQEYKISLSPRLVNDFVKKVQGLVNKIGKVNIDIDTNSQIKNVVNELTEEEKALDTAAEDFVRKEFGESVTPESFKKLKNETKEIITTIANGGKATSNGLVEIVSEDAKTIETHFGSLKDQYDEVVAYIKNSKIHVDDTMKGEFGDDWGKIRGKIGIKNLVKNGGDDAESFVNELNSTFNHPLPDVRDNLDAIRELYEYLTNPPDFSDMYYEMMGEGIDEEIEYYNQQLTEVAKGLNIDTSQSQFLASSLEELDSFNAKYQAELTETKEAFDKEEEIFSQINNVDSSTNETTSATDKNVESVKELSQAFEAEEQSVKEAVANEQNVLNDLINTLNNVIVKVDEKTRAFQEEGQVVDSVILSEITNLETLSGNLILLRDNLKSVDLNVNLNGNSSDVTDFIKSLSKISDTKVTGKLDKIQTSLKQFVSSVNKIKINDNGILASLNGLLVKSKELENLATIIKTSKKKIEEAQKTVESKSSTAETSSVDEAVKQYNRLYDAQIKLSKIESGTKEPLAKYYTEEITKAQQAINNLTLTEEEAGTVAERVSKKQVDAATAIFESQRKQVEQQDKLNKSLEDYQSKVLKQATSLYSNGKLMSEYGDRVREIVNEINSLNTKVDPSDAKERLRQLENELTNISSAAKEAGKSGESFGQTLVKRFKSLAAYLATFVQFYDIVRYVRSAFSTIVDLDTQLVDLRKTTSMTSSELNEFYGSASDVSKQLGVTTSEIISQASAWSRLGYSTKEASTEMAKLSSQFASISPGMDTESATDTLVSTMQAYKIGVDDVQRTVMDNINAIGNSMATTNEEIGEMLQRSSAAMKAANNSLEETIALESAAVEITRNAETTGTAFRTISMRIRGKQSLPPYSENYMLCA